jgi:hypothetical protein
MCRTDSSSLPLNTSTQTLAGRAAGITRADIPALVAATEEAIAIHSANNGPRHNLSNVTTKHSSRRLKNGHIGRERDKIHDREFPIDERNLSHRGVRPHYSKGIQAA